MATDLQRWESGRCLRRECYALVTTTKCGLVGIHSTHASRGAAVDAMRGGGANLLYQIVPVVIEVRVLSGGDVLGDELLSAGRM